MQAGKLRHQIACDEPTLNDAGEITGFVQAFKQRASIEPMRGREQYRADQILADMTTLITVRRSPSTDRINATWRLRHRSTIYNIESIAPDETFMRDIEMLCNSGKNNG